MEADGSLGRIRHRSRPLGTSARADGRPYKKIGARRRERFFREQFPREWIVAVAPPEGVARGMLLAIDGNQRIVGADRVARTSLLLDDRGLQAGMSLWTIFERDLDLFRRRGQSDISTRL